MKIFIKIIFLIFIVEIIFLLLWISPILTGVKIYYAEKHNIFTLLLGSSDQLIFYYPNDRLALQDALSIKMTVAHGVLMDALDISNNMILLYPDDPRPLMNRSSIYLMVGHKGKAIDDLLQAKELIISSGPKEVYDFDFPSVDQIGKILERIENDEYLNNFLKK